MFSFVHIFKKLIVTTYIKCETEIGLANLHS